MASSAALAIFAYAWSLSLYRATLSDALLKILRKNACSGVSCLALVWTQVSSFAGVCEKSVNWKVRCSPTLCFTPCCLAVRSCKRHRKWVTLLALWTRNSTAPKLSPPSTQRLWQRFASNQNFPTKVPLCYTAVICLSTNQHGGLHPSINNLF